MSAILTSRSDVRAVPFYSWLKDLVPSMSDVSAEISLHCGGCGSSLVESLPSLWRRWLLPGWDCAILTSRSDVRAVPFCSWLKDLVPSMSDVSAGHSVE